MMHELADAARRIGAGNLRIERKPLVDEEVVTDRAPVDAVESWTTVTAAAEALLDRGDVTPVVH